MENQAIQSVWIADITVPDRYRKDLGDIQALAQSIDRLGLLQPIGITPSNELIFGARRLEAFKLCGRDRFPARVLDLKSILQGEYDENDVRKDFTPSEKVAIGRAIETELAGRRGRPTRKKVDLDPRFPKGKTRDLAAKKVGFASGRQYERVKAIVDKGASALVAAVDAGQVEIKPAAEFSKQRHEQQIDEITAAGGDVKAAVVAFRKNLPTKHEARKIAAETGAAILGKDGRFHTDASNDERKRGETYLRLAAALRTIRDLGLSPNDVVACIPSGSHPLFGPLIEETAEFIRSVRLIWRSSYDA